MSKQAGVASDGILWLTKTREMMDLVDSDKYATSLVSSAPELLELTSKASKFIKDLGTVCVSERRI